MVLNRAQGLKEKSHEVSARKHNNRLRYNKKCRGGADSAPGSFRVKHPFILSVLFVFTIFVCSCLCCVPWALFFRVDLCLVAIILPCLQNHTFYQVCRPFCRFCFLEGSRCHTGADWVLKPAVAKILKQPFLPFLPLSSLWVTGPGRPRPETQNQAAHVAIAKTPQRPVRLWCHTGRAPTLHAIRACRRPLWRIISKCLWENHCNRHVSH